mmetsp:Transcript_42963/g.69716  ORF Transcript_42963/g.69716 Transcript_42963/m.69716 type:complete len:92 (+) Transcript_42963:71-346(+)
MGIHIYLHSFNATHPRIYNPNLCIKDSNVVYGSSREDSTTSASWKSSCCVYALRVTTTFIPAPFAAIRPILLSSTTMQREGDIFSLCEASR